MNADGILVPSEQRWRGRIRTWAAVLIVIQIAFFGFTMMRSYDSALQEAREHVSDAVRGGEADLNRTIQQFDMTLLCLPRFVELTAGGELALTQILLFDLAQQNVAIRDILLFDAAGAAIVSANAESRRDLTSLPQNFRSRLDENGDNALQVDSPWRNPATGEITILFGRRMPENHLGAQYSVVAAAAALFSDRFAAPSSHPDLRVALIGEGGELLARHGATVKDLGRVIADPARLRAAPPGVWIDEGLMEPGRAVTGTASALDNGLTVVASTGTDLALGGWWAELRVALAVSLAISALIATLTTIHLRLLSQRGEAERALINARDAAEAASRAKSSFLANMSHELRTPLNAIIGFSELIRDRAYGDAEIKRYSAYAADIYASGEHLLRLINDILDLSKIEAGALELVHEEIDLDAFLEGCLSLFASGAMEKGVRLINRVPRRMTLTSDYQALQHIVTNLVSNAVKFTSAGGEVTISAVDTEDGRLRLLVADSGVGIAPSSLALLFEPFQQANPMISRRFGGSGLGLSIVRSYTSLLGGTVDISSQQGVGTTVTIELPTAAAAATP